MTSMCIALAVWAGLNLGSAAWAAVVLARWNALKDEQGGPAMRRYHVIAINERTGAVTVLAAYVCSHHEASVIKARFNPAKHVRIQLQEVRP